MTSGRAKSGVDVNHVTHVVEVVVNLFRSAGIVLATLHIFAQSSKVGTVTKGLEFDVRLANQPFWVFEFRAFWRSTLSVGVHTSQKLKIVA